MANKRRYVRKVGAKGQFKSNELDSPEAKKLFAEKYYNQHKKRVDAAINNYRKSHNIAPSVTNEKIFTDTIKYSARNFGSKKSAKDYIQKKLFELNGGDLAVYEAKHGARNREDYGFSDLRKLNGRLDGNYHDYKYSEPDFEVEGYYEIKGSDVVIAKIIDKSSGSPYEVWEFKNRDEIGL